MGCYASGKFWARTKTLEILSTMYGWREAFITYISIMARLFGPTAPNLQSAMTPILRQHLQAPQGIQLVKSILPDGSRDPQSTPTPTLSPKNRPYPSR